MPNLPLWSSPPPDELPATLRAELKVLRSTTLRVGLLAAGMACSPEERFRLELLAHQDPEGLTTANLQELDIQLRQLTRDVALYAQSAVSKAARLRMIRAGRTEHKLEARPPLFHVPPPPAHPDAKRGGDRLPRP
jgi:hypothetical protein